MSIRYNQGGNFSGATRFTQAPMSEVEFSSMTSNPTWMVPFNAGDIVPVYYAEVLPHDTFSIDLDFVIRQTSASLRPTMGRMQVDYFAFFVPNRVVNESWKNVQGENTSGIWAAPEVQLAPLYPMRETASVQIPVGSIADLYGFPTQMPIRAEVLQQMNDLKFRGYLSIFNEYFRDQNYQPPIPFSKLNVYQGFLKAKGTSISLDPEKNDLNIPKKASADGNVGAGAVTKAIYGEGITDTNWGASIGPRLTNWSALDKPLKANKLHDAFTSVLPTPQKGPEVYFGIADVAPVVGASDYHELGIPLRFRSSEDDGNVESGGLLSTRSLNTGELIMEIPQDGEWLTVSTPVNYTNMVADLSQATGVSVSDLRVAAATQQVYEQLARGGSRYWSMLKSFFGVEVETPFPDIPTQIGHIRRDLDLYQVAQTSASVSGESPQGSLTAFGYTTKGGAMFTKTFLEHGYIHIFAVVRQRNLYSTYLAPDNFRLNTMDFYLPQFANIGEQPIRLATLNPFVEDAMEKAIGYQEPWWEYRFEPDRVHGILRSGVNESLDVWHYGDEFDYSFTHVNGEWLRSNAQEVLDRTLTITSELAPQFISSIEYKVTKQRPMPVYSIPGIDVI